MQMQQAQQAQAHYAHAAAAAAAAAAQGGVSAYAAGAAPYAAAAPAPPAARSLLISDIPQSVADSEIALAVASLGPVEPGSLHVSRMDFGTLRPAALAVVMLASADDAQRAVARGGVAMGSAGAVGTVSWYQA
jgi:hypothetical protein